MLGDIKLPIRELNGLKLIYGGEGMERLTMRIGDMVNYNIESVELITAVKDYVNEFLKCTISSGGYYTKEKAVKIALENIALEKLAKYEDKEEQEGKNV